MKQKIVIALTLTTSVLSAVPAFAADRCHVLAVAADRLAALAAGHACLGRAELVCIAGRMRGASSLCGDRALLVLVHRGEATMGSAVVLAGHGKAPVAWKGSSSLPVPG